MTKPLISVTLVVIGFLGLFSDVDHSGWILFVGLVMAWTL